MTKVELIRGLELTDDDREVTMCIEKPDGVIEFYHINFISGGGEKGFPTMLNGSYTDMDSN